MPGKISLFVPGPTNMPDRVRQAMDISNEDHRAPGMDKFWHPLISDLRKVFETTKIKLENERYLQHIVSCRRP